MSEFKKGDVVKLKSDGPRMTSEDFHRDGGVWCVWFVDDQ